MRLNNNQIHQIVEYIKHNEGMQFDIFELTEELEDVLNYYSFCPEIGQEDRTALVKELLPLAQEYEFQEMENLALAERW